MICLCRKRGAVEIQLYQTAILALQGGAEEKHVFHIKITLFIFNIKKF